MLQSAGLDLAGVQTTAIAVLNRDLMVPDFVFTPDPDGAFGPGGYIEFYGQSLDTMYTDTNIYTVQVSSAVVPQIPVVNASVADGAQAPGSFTETLKVNNQRVYANNTPAEDAWYDTSMVVYTSSKSWNYQFNLFGLADDLAPATLDLTVWGLSGLSQNPDHHMQVIIQWCRYFRSSLRWDDSTRNENTYPNKCIKRRWEHTSNNTSRRYRCQLRWYSA